MELNNWKYIYKNKDKSKNQHEKLIKVACILGYFNGEKYIEEQLKSILNQKQERFSITIFISDDNSNRDFPVLKNFDLENKKNNEIYYRKLEKNIGYANNFIFSLRDINLAFDYFCFSDQDDIWYKEKIETICEDLDLNLTFAPKGVLVPHQGIDVILDEGAFGWEPSLYILAHNPLELVDRMHRLISLF